MTAEAVADAEADQAVDVAGVGVVVCGTVFAAGAGGLGAEFLEVEALAVVADVEGDLVLHVGEGDPDPGGPGVPGHVGQRLLRGA